MSEHLKISPERRQLTVLFCDLVGSTELSVRLDPEDLHQVIRAYQDVCVGVIKRFKGYVAQYLGDGILCYFGFPVAHEDDAELAVRAALKIIEAVNREPFPLHQHAFDPLAVRVAVATGLVVAGDVFSGGEGVPESALGETPNMAARLQTIAKPNTVVIAPSTQSLLGGMFEYEDLGEHVLHGYSKPIRAWEVKRERQAESRFKALHCATLTPFVGRTEELELLLTRWERVKAGKGQVVMLVGEPGIGKSRVVQAFQDEIRSELKARAQLQCSSWHTNSALYPFVGYLKYAAGLIPGDTAKQQLDKLEKLLINTALMQTEKAVPLFAELLSIPIVEYTINTNSSPQQKKSRILTAFVDQLDGISEQGPALIILEDAHWIDPTSAELLDLVVERVRGSSVTLVITSRPGFMPSFSNQPHVALFPLNRLTKGETAKMVQQMARGHNLSEGVVQKVVERADGIPLFIEELINTVVESRPAQDGTEADEKFTPKMIPISLKDSLMARLDRLPVGKELAQIGAVIGREFSHEILVEVSGLNDRQLTDALNCLLESELLFRTSENKGQDVSYFFKHALVKDAAYESLLKSKRRYLHAHVAQVIEERFSEKANTDPELLAHHCTEAGQADKAVKYWGLAAKQALGRSANQEAISHARIALQLLLTLPDSMTRARRELHLQIILGAADRAINGFTSKDTQGYFQRARSLCHQIGQSANTSLIDVLRGLFGWHYARGELYEARQLAIEVVEFTRAHEPDSLVKGYYMLGGMMFWQGEFITARNTLEKAWSHYDRDKQYPDIISAQSDPGSFALFQLGWTLWVLGYPEKAKQKHEQALAIARDRQMPFTLSMALFWAGCSYLSCGWTSAARPVIKELRAITLEHGLPYLGACATVLESHAAIAEGNFALGLEKIRNSQSEFASQGANLGAPWALSAPIIACTELGETDQAMVLVDHALQAIAKSDERHWLAEINRLKAELLFSPQIADYKQAETWLIRALKIARNQQAKSFELRAVMSFTRLWDHQGNRKRAFNKLTKIYNSFSEGFDTHDLVQAREFIEKYTHRG